MENLSLIQYLKFGTIRNCFNRGNTYDRNKRCESRNSDRVSMIYIHTHTCAQAFRLEVNMAIHLESANSKHKHTQKKYIYDLQLLNFCMETKIIMEAIIIFYLTSPFSKLTS